MNIVHCDGGVKIVYGGGSKGITPKTKTSGGHNFIRNRRCPHPDQLKFYPSYTKYPVKYTKYPERYCIDTKYGDGDHKKNKKNVDDVVFVYDV